MQDIGDFGHVSDNLRRGKKIEEVRWDKRAGLLPKSREVCKPGVNTTSLV